MGEHRLHWRRVAQRAQVVAGVDRLQHQLSHLLLLGLLGCGGGAVGADRTARAVGTLGTGGAAGAARVVDRAVSRYAALRGFREGLPPVDSLSGGTRTREELV